MLVALLFASLTSSAFAQEDEAGSVRLPLSTYQELLGGGDGEHGPRHAFSDVRVETRIEDRSGGARASVTVNATVRTFGEGWTLVPLAASGAISSASAGGSQASLVDRGGMVAWPVEGSGSHSLSWTYHVDARSYEGGWVVALPTPGAGAQLTATFAGMDVSPMVMPASNVATNRAGNDTRVTANVPAGSGVQVSWRADASGGHTLSRARYVGEVVGDSVRFTAEMSVELESGRALVPLFPSTVALESVRIDRAEAPIAVHEGRFAVPVRGRGRHRIAATFLVPIARDAGLPHVALNIASTPVSRFELSLPGDRELEVTPRAGVDTTRRGDRTLARFNVPMSEHVRIQWSEAVPEVAAVETRAHASIVHVVRPDEGVLTMRAFVSYEISRGTMRRAEIILPADVQVNAVENAAGVVSDWRVAEEGRDRSLTVFLDREVSESLELIVTYERSWPVATRTSDAFGVPLLRAEGVHRQRGMVALLAMRELTLEPRDAAHLTRVGDNQLPTSVRDQLETTVAHTFRYLDEAPRLAAVGAIREPEPARFDVQVDTLVSLGDVSTTVATRIEVEVKSGSLSELTLRVPEGLSLLEVSAPSLRRYVLENEGRALRVELTQPMEGRFTVELLCDRVTGQEEEVTMPLLGVEGAEVERGRLGVEALAPFQVDMAAAEHLSPIDSSELPESLLLRTDNPILHAYRYAQADEPPRFAVRITRHDEIQTRHATVEEARYSTLYTRDGVAVTTARFVVRNRSQQFLRATLPPGSEVWSARVDGRSQTPALEAGSDPDEPTVLLNIVSAADAFDVELTYATEVPELGSVGRLGAQLPRLDIVVTRTVWEVLLPEGVDYAEPTGTLTVVEGGYYGSFSEAPTDALVEAAASPEGVRWVFQQMYVGSDDEVASFSVPYVTGWGGVLAKTGSALGALLLWLGILAFGMLRFGWGLPEEIRARIPLASYRVREEGIAPPRAMRRTWATVGVLIAVGLLLLIIAHVWLSLPLTTVWVISGIVLMALLGIAAKQIAAKLPKPRKLATAATGAIAPIAPVPDPPPSDELEDEEEESDEA